MAAARAIPNRRALALPQLPGLGAALVLFVALRISFSLLGVAIYTVAPRAEELPPCTRQNGIELHTAPLDAQLVGVWQRWDACWYEKIAAHNYQPRDRSIAFPPLFPALMRAGGSLLGDNLTLSGLVVSALAYVAAMLGLYRLVRDDFDDRVAGRTLLYQSVAPTAFFLFMPYTEAVYLALSVWTFVLARRRAWGPAALLACCAGLTRMPAVLLALPLAWELFRQWREERRPRLAWLVPAAPIASFLLYDAYATHVLDWSYFTALATWNNRQAPPWTALAESWRYIQSTWQPVEMINLGMLVIFTILLVVGAKRLPFSYTLYAAAQLLLIGCRYCSYTPLMSAARYLLVVFPIFVILALLLRRPWQHALWLASSLAALLFLTSTVLIGLFAG